MAATVLVPRPSGVKMLPAAHASLIAIAIACLLSPAPARAQATGGPADMPFIEVHGFVSQGYLLTTGNEYLVADSTKGSFQLSEAGINFTKAITSKLRAGLQLFAQNFGPGGDYDAQLDWFYLDYRWQDWLGLRAGRLKIPYGLYNEVNDIDAARVPILLPQSVYPLQTRSFLFAQTGGEVYGYLRMGAAGALEYRLFLGTIFIDPSLLVPAGSPLQLEFSVPYVAGGRLLWETPLTGLRVGGSMQKLRLDTTVFTQGMMIAIDNNSLLSVASAEYVAGPLVLTAEYSRWYTKQTSVIASSNFDQSSERMYGMITCALTHWLQPGVYYALYFPDVDSREGLANRQHDLTLTLRFDITPHWLVKLEGHYMAGTAGLAAPLRVGPAPTDPDRHWSVFLAKTTLSF